MIDFKGHRFVNEIILTCVRWYLAYPLSYWNFRDTDVLDFMNIPFPELAVDWS